ncbi:MAG: decarboxylating 6-phosphogluconate dehydrogenase [Labilithrix sp.]|nr:decarboxylating 6-phosphogluconate dehydrogenase [Labilithrix sp.]MCW5816633.1 decarboxylating 6-phosphogluconate dehydrogenase [Labilithrix sp.]
MQIAIVGLGKMGGNMVRRLVKGGHEVVGYDRDPAVVAALAKEGMVAAGSLAEVVAKLSGPRAVWIMVPAGAPTEDTIVELSQLLAPNDILIDGGNSNFKDSVRRAKELADKQIRFLDAGTSGGVWGLANGYCLMIGGDESAYEAVLPALTTLAPKDGLAYFGSAGAGHYVKMVHNGIEYAMMQAYAEGFELLKECDYKFDLRKVTRVWNRGSVVRSWLCELAENAFNEDPELSKLKAYVNDSGEGRWTVDEAVRLGVALPTIALSLFARFDSRKDNPFGLRVLAALRNQFGGHAVTKA